MRVTVGANLLVLGGYLAAVRADTPAIQVGLLVLAVSLVGAGSWLVAS